MKNFNWICWFFGHDIITKRHVKKQGEKYETTLFGRSPFCFRCGSDVDCKEKEV